MLQYPSRSTSETLIAAELCLLDSIERSTLKLEMVDLDNNLFGQWTLKTRLGMDNGHRRCFGQWTLKNMLNVDDAYTRISIIVPDTHLDTSPEFLFEQCSRVPVPISNC